MVSMENKFWRKEMATERETTGERQVDTVQETNTVEGVIMDAEDTTQSPETRGCGVVRVGRKNVEVPAGTPFIDEIRKIARENGISKFRIQIAEIEISADEVPSVFESNMEAQIIPHDVPRD